MQKLLGFVLLLSLFISQNSVFASSNTTKVFITPQNVFSDWSSADLDSDKTIINLLTSSLVDDPDVTKLPPFKRLDQFGTWIYYDANLCLNTRAKVLVKFSDPDKVQYTTEQKCHVKTGLWYFDYSDEWQTVASEIDIDHLVPLKNAYVSGAWKWTNKRRCHFTNFMENDFHLLPVSNHENRVKGDKGPEGYLPPNPAARCTYIKRWLFTKVVWHLTLTSEEFDQIKVELEKNNCPHDTVLALASEIKVQQMQIENLPYGCTLRPEPSTQLSVDGFSSEYYQ